MGLRVTILALILSLGLGCFVFDELDSSKELLDKPSFGVETQKKQQAPASPEPRVNAENSEGKDSKPLADWWKKSRSVTSSEAKSDLVRCGLGGTTQFMRRPDCLARGGTPR
jgi:hypothetical protein